MGKRLFLSLMIFGFSFAGDLEQIKPQRLEGEGTYRVIISLKDISRIVCPVEFKSDPVYSKEKYIVMKRAGKNIFVKIQPKKYVDQQTQDVKMIEYPPGRREAIVKCGDDVFTLIMEPKDVPTQTIYLNAKVKKSEEVKEFEKASDYEETLLKLIKYAYLEKMPRGYRVEYPELSKDFAELKMELNRRYIGYYYIVDVYQITPKMDMDVDEAVFIPYLEDGLKALALESLKLKKGKKVRLFVVRKNKLD